MVYVQRKQQTGDDYQMYNLVYKKMSLCSSESSEFYSPGELIIYSLLVEVRRFPLEKNKSGTSNGSMVNKVWSYFLLINVT